MSLFPVFGGKAFAHVEVVRLDAALHRGFLRLVFRLIPVFFRLSYVVPSNEVNFLLELVVLFDEELVHLHQLPVRLVFAFLLAHTFPLDLLGHFH